MYKERYEMLKEAEKTGANISPIDYSFIDWYEKEAVKYTPQNTSSNSDYAKCKDCGAPMNEGEAKTFTVCDDCWEKHFA